MSIVDRADVSRRRARAGRIREGMKSYIHTLGEISAAYAERDWEHLGYGSWAEYVDEEFGADRLQLSPEHRQKAVNELRLAGLSQRAIGSALGVSAATVNADLAGVQDRTPDEAPAQVRGIDGKTYTPKISGPTGAADHTPPADPDKTPARRDLAPSDPPESEVIRAGEPDQLGEVAPAAGGREDGATSSFEPPAGPSDVPPVAVVPPKGRPGLEGFVNDDPAVKAASYTAAFAAALARAGGFMSFDAERIAELASPSTWDAIEAHASVVAHWYETARKARTGLRVIKGGVA